MSQPVTPTCCKGGPLRLECRMCSAPIVLTPADLDAWCREHPATPFAQSRAHRHHRDALDVAEMAAMTVPLLALNAVFAGLRAWAQLGPGSRS